MTSIQFLLRLAILALVLAACAPASPSTPVPQPSPTSPLFTPTVSRAVSTPAAPSKDVIKIATISPLSGEQGTLGEGFKLAAQLAVKRLAKPLSDLGFRVEAIAFDDQARVDSAVQRARAIAADPDVLVVIGHLNSDTSIAASEIYKDTDLAMISPTATRAQLTTRGYGNVNRLCGRDDVQGSAAARLATEQLHSKNIFVVHDKTTFGQATAQSFAAEIKKLGASLAGIEGTEEKFYLASVANSIKNSNADALFFTGGHVQGGNLLRHLKERNIRIHFIATERIDTADLPLYSGDAVQGIYFQTSNTPASLFPDAASFALAYKAEFNKDTPVYAAYAYDASAIALESLATLAKEGKPTRKAVAQAIRATKNYRGITGTYTFNQNGDPALAKYFFVQVTHVDPRRWGENVIYKFVEVAPPTQ